MTTTDRVRQVYERLARGYDLGIPVMERVLGMRAGRAWLCGATAGKVLEVGIGTGRNLPYYPPEVELTGIDLSPAMLVLARQGAQKLQRSVEFLEGDATALPFADSSFDAVVSALTLCTVPDPVRAVHEALRVLRPGGEFRCLEHGRSSGLVVDALLRLLDGLAQRFEADHLRREPDRILEAAGARIRELHRSRAGVVWRVCAVAP